MEKGISNKVLEKIKKEDIKPIPKWEFLLKKGVLWVILSLTLLLGGIATAVTIFVLKSSDWGVHQYLHESFWGFLIGSLPYFWLALLVIFVGVALYNFKHMGHGYRYRIPVILGVVVGISLLLGFLLFSVGIGKAVDNVALQNLSFYEQMGHTKEVERWMQPEKGLLGGEVLNRLEKGNFKLADFEGNSWVVIVPRDRLGVPPKEGLMVKIFGEMLDEETFEAKEIRLWQSNIREVRRENLKKLKERFLDLRNR